MSYDENAVAGDVSAQASVCGRRLNRDVLPPMFGIRHNDIESDHEASVVLDDGVCGFCNRCVQFVLRHDDEKIFRFASLQSSFGTRVFTERGVDTPVLETVYVLPSDHEGKGALQRYAYMWFRLASGTIWVQLGCNRTFPPFLRAPKLAIDAVDFRTVTSDP